MGPSSSQHPDGVELDLFRRWSQPPTGIIWAWAWCCHWWWWPIGWLPTQWYVIFPHPVFSYTNNLQPRDSLLGRHGVGFARQSEGHSVRSRQTLCWTPRHPREFASRRRKRLSPLSQQPFPGMPFSLSRRRQWVPGVHLVSLASKKLITL